MIILSSAMFENYERIYSEYILTCFTVIEVHRDVWDQGLRILCATLKTEFCNFHIYFSSDRQPILAVSHHLLTVILILRGGAGEVL